MRVAIVGANGFIGRHVSRALFARPGVEVVLISRTFGPLYGRRFPGVPLHEVDFRDSAAVAPLCAEADIVIDLVSSETPRTLSSLETPRLLGEVRAHYAFFEELARRGGKHVFFISSGGTVYGSSDRPRLAETDPTEPVSGYGLGKLLIEQGLRFLAQTGGLGHTILRVSNPFGPGQVMKGGQGIIPALIEKLRSNEPFTVFGDGSAVRDYLFIDDLTAALVKSVERAGRIPGETINIGSGRGTSVLDLIRTLEAVAGTTLRIVYSPDHPSIVSRNVLDISKAKALLDWAPAVSLEEGLRAMLEAGRDSGGASAETVFTW